MIIIHGKINQGKTTRIKEIISYLKENNKTIGGFYAEKIIQNKQVIGYDMVLISTNESFPFLRLSGTENQQKIGPYYINDFTLVEGTNQIKKSIINKVDVIIIDEVGKLELHNKGWFIALEKLFTTFTGEIILAVRTDFVKKIIQKWNLKEVKQFLVSDNFLKSELF